MTVKPIVRVAMSFRVPLVDEGGEVSGHELIVEVDRRDRLARVSLPVGDEGVIGLECLREVVEALWLFLRQ